MLAATGAAEAKPVVYGGKLLLTRGVTSIEGASGAGLATWAVIAGNETEDGVGASAFATQLALDDYDFTAWGGAIGLFDRVEISYAHQEFGTGATGALLGLGADFTFAQDIYGLKVRVLGDAVYDQDRWLPQIAIGLQHKQNDQKGVIGAIGGEDDSGTDYYIAATKILLNQSLVLNGAVRLTEANQTGILGFGGDRESDQTAQWEVSAAYMLSDRLIVGGEYRTRPDNLGFAEEDDAYDIFAAYAVTHNLSVVGGFVALGDIATFEDQDGLYLSLQVGF